MYEEKKISKEQLEGKAQRLLVDFPDILSEFLAALHKPDNEKKEGVKESGENEDSQAEHSPKRSVESNEKHKTNSKVHSCYRVGRRQWLREQRDRDQLRR